MTRSPAAGPDRHYARLAEHLTALRDTAVHTTPTTDDHGIDLIAHTPDGGMVLYQTKTHQQRPGPPPALTGTRVPEPPPPKTDARAA